LTRIQVWRPNIMGAPDSVQIFVRDWAGVSPAMLARAATSGVAPSLNDPLAVAGEA
jgi:hypothetical protein